MYCTFVYGTKEMFHISFFRLVNFRLFLWRVYCIVHTYFVCLSVEERFLKKEANLSCYWVKDISEGGGLYQLCCQIGIQHMNCNGIGKWGRRYLKLNVLGLL